MIIACRRSVHLFLFRAVLALAGHRANRPGRRASSSKGQRPRNLRHQYNPLDSRQWLAWWRAFLVGEDSRVQARNLYVEKNPWALLPLRTVRWDLEAQRGRSGS